MSRLRWLLALVVCTALVTGCTSTSSANTGVGGGSQSSADRIGDGDDQVQDGDSSSGADNGTGTDGDGENDDTAGASDTAVSLTQVTPSGSKLALPADWEIVENASGKTMHTFRAEGPDGSYVRVDQNLEWDGVVDPEPNARDLETRLAKKYPDLVTYNMEWVLFGGTDALQWYFSHTNDDGVKVEKIDYFIQDGADNPPMAIVVAYPEASTDAAATCQRILDSFVP